MKKPSSSPVTSAPSGSAIGGWATVRGRSLLLSVLVAALFWFWMFCPLTKGVTDFWVTMFFAELVLITLAFRFHPTLGREVKVALDCRSWGKVWGQLLLGVVIAAALWGVFWVGDKVSQWLFGFARDQVDTIYGMKEGGLISPKGIAALLLFVIGPCEELFWRGFVQRSLVERFAASRTADDWHLFGLTLSRGRALAFVITALAYTLIHVWSFNFMLVMAALVAGCLWGFLYFLKPSWLPALVISHALWDACVFVIFPI